MWGKLSEFAEKAKNVALEALDEEDEPEVRESAESKAEKMHNAESKAEKMELELKEQLEKFQELEMNCISLKDRLRQKDSERATFQEVIKHRESQMMQLTEELEMLREKALSHDAEESSEEGSFADSALVTAKKQVISLSDRLQEAEKTVLELQAANRRLQEQQEAHEMQVSGMKESMVGAVSSWEEERASFVSQLEKLKEEGALLESRRKTERLELESRIEQKEQLDSTGTSNESGWMEEFESQIGLLNEDLAAKQALLKSSDSERSELHLRVKQLEEELSRASTQADPKVEEKVAEVTQDNKLLKAGLEKCQKERDECMEREQALQNELAQLNAQSSDLFSSVSLLTSQKKQMESAMEAERLLSKDLELKCEGLHNDVTRSEQEIQRLSSLADRLRAQLRQASDDKVAADEDLLVLRQQVRKLEASNASSLLSQSEYQECIRRAEGLQNEATLLKSNASAKDAKIAQLEKTVQEWEGKYEALLHRCTIAESSALRCQQQGEEVNARHKEQTDAFKGTINGLKLQLAKSESVASNSTQYWKELEQLRAERDELLDEVRSLKEIRSNLHTALERLQSESGAEVTALHKQLRVVEAEAAELKATLKEKLQTVGEQSKLAFAEERRCLEEKCAAAEGQLIEQSATVSKLKMVIAQLQSLGLAADNEETMVDRRLVENLLVSYFKSGQKTEVLNLICNILHFSEDSRVVVGTKQRGWSWLFGGGDPPPLEESTESLGNLWIKFLLDQTGGATIEREEEEDIEVAAEVLEVETPTVEEPQEKAPE